MVDLNTVIGLSKLQFTWGN